MSFDGKAERDNIETKLKELANGRVHRGITDDTILETFPNGTVKPYIVLLFGRPIPTAGDRGMGVGEKGQPYIMAFTVGACAADSVSAESLAADITDLMLDFLPNGDNATPIKGAGGYSYVRSIPQNKPTRFEEPCFFTTVINMSVG